MLSQFFYLRKSIGSQVKLIHVSTGQALKFSGKVYPEWGFYQNEIVCDKNHNQLDTIWNVEEHRYTKSKILFIVKRILFYWIKKFNYLNEEYFA